VAESKAGVRRGERLRRVGSGWAPSCRARSRCEGVAGAPSGRRLRVRPRRTPTSDQLRCGSASRTITATEANGGRAATDPPCKGGYDQQLATTRIADTQRDTELSPTALRGREAGVAIDPSLSRSGRDHAFPLVGLLIGCGTKVTLAAVRAPKSVCDRHDWCVAGRYGGAGPSSGARGSAKLRSPCTASSASTACGSPASMSSSR
jgi:hypothetical protein